MANLAVPFHKCRCLRRRHSHRECAHFRSGATPVGMLPLEAVIRRMINGNRLPDSKCLPDSSRYHVDECRTATTRGDARRGGAGRRYVLPVKIPRACDRGPATMRSVSVQNRGLASNFPPSRWISPVSRANSRSLEFGKLSPIDPQ